MSADLKPNLLTPRWRKVFSDLWGDKGRTGLVVASIAVGVFAVGMIITAFVILSEDINRSYAATNPPNIIVWTDPFDKDLIQSIEKLPGIKAAEGRRQVAIRARRGDENWKSLLLIGITNFTDTINRLTPIEGRVVPGKNEVLVSQDLLHVTGFHPGDRVEIEFPDGSKHFLTVVGLVTDQAAAKLDLGATNHVFVTMKTLDDMGQDQNFNQLYATVTGDGNNLAFTVGVAAEVKAKVKDSQRTVYRMDEKLSGEHPMTSLVLAVIGILGALGGLITILSSSLIINTLNALFAQQLRQIGIMKLVGARRIQIMGMYLTLIIAYGLIALVLAVPLGALAGNALAWLIAVLMGAVLQGFRVIPVAVVAQVLIAILIPLGAGFLPVNSGARTKVQQAISNYRPGDQTAKSNLSQLNARWFRWISRPLRLSFRNTFRKRGRLLLTLFTLTIAGAVFIAVFNVSASMNHLMDQVMQHFMGDITVTFHEPYPINRVTHTLLAIPGVARVEGWGGATGEVWDKGDHLIAALSIVAAPQDSQLMHPEFVAGRWLLPGEKDALVVSDTIYNYYPGLKPGDRLLVKLPGRTVESWTVVGVFRFVSLLGDLMGYANFDFIADRIYLPSQAATYRIITTPRDAASQLALTRYIDQYLQDRNYAVQNVQFGPALRSEATHGINTLILFLLIMALLTAVVGSIGLTGTMSINVLERTREIGVMRTIGAVDGVIMQSVIIEGLVIGLITWFLAIGLSFPISSFLLAIIGEAILGSPMTTSFTPLGILLWLAVVVALSVFASLMPARNAARLTINEVLAYE